MPMSWNGGNGLGRRVTGGRCRYPGHLRLAGWVRHSANSNDKLKLVVITDETPLPAAIGPQCFPSCWVLHKDGAIEKAFPGGLRSHEPKR